MIAFLAHRSTLTLTVRKRAHGAGPTARQARPRHPGCGCQESHCTTLTLQRPASNRHSVLHNSSTSFPLMPLLLRLGTHTALPAST